MRIQFALLADAAQATPDGKFSIIGGGLDTIYAAKFPALHQSISMVIKLDVTKAEIGIEHTLRIELKSPLNATAMPPLVGKFTPQSNKDHPDWAVTAQLAITIAPLILETEGNYTFRLSVDNVEHGKILVRATKLTPDQLAPNQIAISKEGV